MNLRYIEKVNKLTQEIVDVRLEIITREMHPPHKRVGAWRHQYNIDILKTRAEFLEKKRMALFRIAPKLMREVNV